MVSSSVIGSFYSWFNPFCRQKSTYYEHELLKNGQIPIEDGVYCRSLMINVGDGNYINTLITDQRGLDVGVNAERDCVVLCHGFASGIGMFFKNIWSMSKEHRVFTMDWLGMGRSSRPHFPSHYINKDGSVDNDHCINFFLDSLHAWRKNVGLSDTNISLVGHSLGGYLATLYAIKYPQNVKKLILLSPVGIPKCDDSSSSVVGTPIPKWLKYIWEHNVTPQGIIRFTGPFGPTLVRWFTDIRMSSSLTIEERKLVSNYLYHILADSGSGEYALSSILSPGAWARKPLFNLFHQIKIPITFIYGDSDWMDHRHALKVIETLENTSSVKIISIPKSGHLLFVDNWTALNEELQKELKI